MGKSQSWVAALTVLVVGILAFAWHDNILRIVGQTKPHPPIAASTFAKSVYSLPTCESAPDSNTVGTVNIVLPDKFDGNKITRNVNHGPKEPKDDPNTGNGQNGFDSNDPAATEPFDVYVNWNGYPSSGYLLARVLLTKGSKFSFYQNGDFFGVGRNDANDAILCGGAAALSKQNPGNDQAQEIATFYVDLAKLFARGGPGQAHFTVGLVGNSGAGSTTPILIDPKITDSGGGTRNNPG